MTMKSLLIAVLLSLPMLAAQAADGEGIAVRSVSVTTGDGMVSVGMDLNMDSLKLPRNRQMFVTPYLEGKDGQRAMLPTVLINGRNMQYVYERSGLPRRLRAEYGELARVVARRNGTTQTVSYLAATSVQPWMRSGQNALRLSVDTCGCGFNLGNGMSAPLASVNLNPAGKMYLAFVTPPVSELPVEAHEGRARVQFEVDSMTLHDQPYRCRSGQRIDNRSQLALIDDSVRYALSDPNVEIASIQVCGYASPESPYAHNDYLATGRSRSLAHYLAQRYLLPQDRCTFSAVPENWEEFRRMTLESRSITEQQRTQLLSLIDKPAYGPADYDDKERELKTAPQFAQLYRTRLLPQWFPLLRYTQFIISTHLRPMTDEQLARIILEKPQMLSLNQMFRVARLYPEGSDEFNATISTALRFYADDPVANANAAVAAIKAGRMADAEALLARAGNLPEAENARGVMAAHRGDYEQAMRHFEAAGELPEALKNKALLQ